MLLKLLLLRFCNVDIYFYTHFVITQNVVLYFLLQSVTPITTFKGRLQSTMQLSAYLHYITLFT